MKPSQADLQSLVNELQDMFNDHTMYDLTDFQQRSLVANYDQLVKAMASLNKSLSKRAFRAYFDLIKYQGDIFQHEIRSRMETEITLYRKELDAQKEQLDEREARLDRREAKLSTVLSDSDIKLIQGCLHPDRVDEKHKLKYNKAFTIFQRVL